MTADTAACCGLDSAHPVSGMWFQTLSHDRQRDIVRAHGRTLPFMVGPPYDYDQYEKYRPGAVHVDVSIGFPDALHGTGMRLIIVGCGQRLRRPHAWALCAECGRAELLGRPPRGWPRPLRARHRRFYALAGWRLGSQVGSSTTMRGIAVRATERIEAT
jgi:hypothetical protein